MGNVRFKRTVSLFGGLLKLNINKKSISLSSGIPGIGATLSKDKLHYHMGIPGTGLSYVGQKKLKFGGSNGQLGTS